MAFRRKEHRETNGPDFSRKKQSVNGIVSVGIGIFALAVFISASVLSSKDVSGNAFVCGIMGIVVLLFSATGIAYAADGFKEKDINMIFPIIGICANSGLFIYMVCLYLYGLVVR